MNCCPRLLPTRFLRIEIAVDPRFLQAEIHVVDVITLTMGLLIAAEAHPYNVAEREWAYDPEPLKALNLTDRQYKAAIAKLNSMRQKSPERHFYEKFALPRIARWPMTGQAEAAAKMLQELYNKRKPAAEPNSDIAPDPIPAYRNRG